MAVLISVACGHATLFSNCIPIVSKKAANSWETKSLSSMDTMSLNKVSNSRYLSRMITSIGSHTQVLTVLNRTKSVTCYSSSFKYIHTLLGLV